MKRFALTAIGRDRPGIVASVTKVLFEHDCNIEDSSMTRLQDEFAIILIMTAPDSIDMDSLREELKRIEGLMSLTIHLKEIEEGPAARGPGSTHIVSVSGYDKPGIVHKTADFLSEWGINITDLETKIIEGEDRKIYIMFIEVSIPEGMDTNTMSERLRDLGKSMGVTIELKPIETYESL